MIIEPVANPVQEVFDAENIQVIPASKDAIESMLKFIAALLVLIAVIGIFIFYLFA